MESTQPFSSSGNGYDFVVRLSRERNAKVSVDPVVIDELAKINVNYTEPTILPTIKLLTQEANKAGLVVNPVTLSPTITVLFMTTPAAWHYYQAMESIKNGKIQQAYMSLNTSADNSEFGVQIAGLKGALQKILQRNQAITETEKEFKAALERLHQALSAVANAKAFARNIHSVGGNAEQMMAMRAELEEHRAEESLNTTWNQILKFNDTIFNDDEVLISRFKEAYAEELLIESNMILNHLVDGLTRMKTLLALAAGERVAHSTPKFDEITTEIRDFQTEFRRNIDSAEGTVRGAIAALDFNADRAGELFIAAHAIDKSSLFACAGLGLCKIEKHTEALRQILSRTTATSLSLAKDHLIHDLQLQQKYQMLEVLSALSTTNAPEPFCCKSVKIGSAKGLAVQQDKGAIFGISATIASVSKKNPSEEQKEGGYWARLTQRLRANEGADEPIEFGDYGLKDIFIAVSAVQALKWMRFIDPDMTTSNLGLKIEFHNLFNPKGGDSAGVTMAICAYSSLKMLGLRQDLAMTGSIRADGAIKAVGGVPEKIEGANVDLGVETILVPQENRVNLVAVPIDVLCRMALVTLQDIRDYINFSTIQPPTAPAAEIKARNDLQKAIVKLRIAQALLLLGEHTVSRTLLDELTVDHPEIYNASRLLELLGPSMMQPDNSGLAFTRADADKLIQALIPDPLLPPNGLKAVPGTNQIVLTWAPSMGASAYFISRMDDAVPRQTTETNYTETNLSPNSNYYFTVTASNAFSMAQTPQLLASTLPMPQTPQPSTPTPPPDPWWKNWYILAGALLILGYLAFKR